MPGSVQISSAKRQKSSTLAATFPGRSLQWPAFGPVLTSRVRSATAYAFVMQRRRPGPARPVSFGPEFSGAFKRPLKIGRPAGACKAAGQKLILFGGPQRVEQNDFSGAPAVTWVDCLVYCFFVHAIF
jgi:hypothetical protein